MSELSSSLVAALPEGRVLTAPSSVERYLHDEAAWAPWEAPLAAVRPESTAEVQAVVRWCARNGVAVVPRGAGTGLSGGANAVAGSVVLSLERMDRIVEIDVTERIAVVQPGLVNDHLRAAAAEVGLWYPPDPASSPWSTVGGNIATNAGGVCCVKYGVTGDYVLELEVVTALGEAVRFGRRTAKGVAGYDVVSLLVGSEGTLGIVTEAVLRLRPARPRQLTVAGHFGSAADAGRAVTAVLGRGIVPAAMELVDRHCLEAVDAWKNIGLAVDAEVLLLGQTDAPGAAGLDEVRQMVACFEEAGASFAAHAEDEQESEAMMAARRLAYPALERLGPVLTEDVCVPVRQIPEMLARIDKAAEAHDVLIANIAHAGDGNLHPLLITPAGDEAARLRARDAFDTIIADALALGGTVTGEHGVGLLKADGVRRELDPAALAIQHALKDALDPDHLLNPGKGLPGRS